MEKENKETTEVIPVDQQSLLLDVGRFEHAQRVAKLLVSSSMVPEQFQGDKNIGNCVIALNLAERMRLDPFMVMQKIYVVNGKPGIEAQLAIALVNNTRRFTPLQFKLEGEGDKRRCTCHAKRRDTGETCQQSCDVAIAKKEGWWDKKGSKWPTMTDMMLQYRSAMFFARLYCPEALLGMPSADELDDSEPQRKVIKADFEEIKPAQDNPVHSQMGNTENGRTLGIEFPDPAAQKTEKRDLSVKKNPETKPEKDPEQPGNGSVSYNRSKSELHSRFAKIRTVIPLSPTQNKTLTDAITAISDDDSLARATARVELLEYALQLHASGKMDSGSLKEMGKTMANMELAAADISDLQDNLRETFDTGKDDQSDGDGKQDVREIL